MKTVSCLFWITKTSEPSISLLFEIHRRRGTLPATMINTRYSIITTTSTHYCLFPSNPQVAQLGSRQRLRSSSSSAFVVPATRRSTLGDRSFSAAGTRAWNSLPPTVTAASTLSSFLRYLKSHLFTKSFPSWRWLQLADSTRCECVKCPCSF